jgi:hypothetical protein
MWPSRKPDVTKDKDVVTAADLPLAPRLSPCQRAMSHQVRMSHAKSHLCRANILCTYVDELVEPCFVFLLSKCKQTMRVDCLFTQRIVAFHIKENILNRKKSWSNDLTIALAASAYSIHYCAH